MIHCPDCLEIRELTPDAMCQECYDAMDDYDEDYSEDRVTIVNQS